MAKKDEVRVMKYYTIEPGEGEEEIMVVGKADKGISVLVHTFTRGEEEEARALINAVAKSPNYMWDLNGQAKILRSYIKGIQKRKKIGKPIPFYYAVLKDGKEFPLAMAQGK